MKGKITCWSFSTPYGMENCALYDVSLKHFVPPSRIGKGKLTYTLEPGRNYILFNLSRLVKGEYYFQMTHLYLNPNDKLTEQHIEMVMFPSTVYKYILNDPEAPQLLKDFLKLQPEGETPALPNFIREYVCMPNSWEGVVEKIKDYLEEVT